MIEPFFPNPVLYQRLRGGPLGAHIDVFAQQLSDQGYARSTARCAMRLLADFGTWLEQQGTAIAQLDAAALEVFLQHRYRCWQPHRGDRQTLMTFLAYLEASGVIVPSQQPPEGEVRHGVVRAFQEHLTNQRQLAPATVRSHLATVDRFLQWRFGEQPPELAALCAQDLSAFMLAQARRYSVEHTQRIATVLRSFLHFLLQSGAIATDLTPCVPAPARRRLMELPRFMPGEDVERLLQSIDQATAQGLRDYAIMLLLARLGLRAREVAALCLEDLGWDAAEVLIRGKGECLERMPLPWDVGEALSHYLRDARPPCSTRQVFVCMRAPRRGFAHGGAVSTIARRALARADLHPPHQGAYLLRHSLATRLLREGASLAEIGELLRHRHPQTTQIYAKVDERTLGELALAWPGGAS